MFRHGTRSRVHARGGDVRHAARASARALRPSRRLTGLDAKRLALIEPLVAEAIARHELPGAVVLAGRGNQILYKRAFGNRAVAPASSR